MKTIFKKGDRVFDFQFGWGKVINIINKELLVKFDRCTRWYSRYGSLGSSASKPTLSFTEYTLQGFSRERPIDYNEYIGKWGMFWYDADDYRLIDKLGCIDGGVFQTETGGRYYNFKPLTDEQIKILEL